VSLHYIDDRRTGHQPRPAILSSNGEPFAPNVPHDHVAELAVLSAIVLRNEVLPDVQAIVNAKHFHRDAHRKIFCAILGLAARGDSIEIITLRNALARANELEDVGGVSYLAKLTDGVPISKVEEHRRRATSHAKIVRERARDRRHAELGQQLNEAGSNDPERVPEILAQLKDLEADGDGTGFRSALDVISDPPIPIVVDGIVWAGCITTATGESGVGKSFVIADMASALGGHTWQGRGVVSGSVAYVYFEGSLGVRLRAIQQAGRPVDHVYTLLGTKRLSPAVARDQTETPSQGELDLRHELEALSRTLAEKSRPPVRLLIIDTARASMSGSEDASENVNAYLGAIRRLLRVIPDAGAIIVHHTGWQDADKPRKRERGSSDWRGSVDGSILLEAVGEPSDTGDVEVRITTMKVRDGRVPSPFSLIRRQVLVGDVIDSLGRPATSCIMVDDPALVAQRASDAAARAAAEQRVNDLKVLRAVRGHAITSISDLIAKARLGTGPGNEAISRVTASGELLKPEKRGLQYRLSEDALTALREA
jgi:hypothetical protein